MKNLHRLTIFYLILPFIIFCMGWLRLSIAIPLVAVILWTVWQLLKQRSADYSAVHLSRSTFFYLLLITGLWVFLSGVGGYAFQNWDHHWRNAVLRDLINYDWPVFYSTPETGPVKMLVYYVGYWLPAALVGKVLGWQAANFFLFLWTWLGVVLVIVQLGLKQKASALKVTLFLIFFSGMDALGSLLFAKDYPTLWPPVQHLEIWAGNLQYSAFTTQLFWVFNQAVPAWLCIVVILDLDSKLSEKQGQTLEITQKIFIWSLCFFFAPLASIGLFPYLLIEFVKGINLKNPLKSIRLDLFFGSMIIVIISYLFFSSNTAAQEREFQLLAIKDFSAFFLLEGGFLWLLLAQLKWHDPHWIVTGILLFIMPFIQLGSDRDFVMRASIAPLFYLLLMVGEVVFQNTSPRLLRYILLTLLIIGALTPLYEINRSIYRTYQYYFLTDNNQRIQPNPEPLTHLAQGVAPEFEHPKALIADDIKTLKFMDDKISKNFIANVRQSLYYRYLAPR